MTPLLDQQKAAKDTMDAYTAVRRSYRTEHYREVVEWIECLMAQVQASMTSCAPAKLPDVQVRFKQLSALRSALVDPGGASTGFTFD